MLWVVELIHRRGGKEHFTNVTLFISVTGACFLRDVGAHGDIPFIIQPPPPLWMRSIRIPLVGIFFKGTDKKVKGFRQKSDQ